MWVSLIGKDDAPIASDMAFQPICSGDSGGTEMFQKKTAVGYIPTAIYEYLHAVIAYQCHGVPGFQHAVLGM